MKLIIEKRHGGDVTLTDAQVRAEAYRNSECMRAVIDDDITKATTIDDIKIILQKMLST